MRARLALAVSGQQCELREIVLRNKPQALIQASPKATVPVLVLENGQVLEQSLDIMLWALRRNDPKNWLSPEDESLDAMLALIDECDQVFKPDLDRYKYPQRFESDGTPAEALQAKSEWHRDHGAQWLQTLDNRLQGKEYLFGSCVSLADMAILPFVRQYAHVDREWFNTQGWKALRNWLDAWMASSQFVGVMAKYRPWTPDSAVEQFPS